MATNRYISLVALTLLILASTVDLGAAQAFCFRNQDFSCSGAIAATMDTGEECCEAGFLNYRVSGRDPCIQCPENVICYNQTSDCSGGFDPSQARTFLDCCDNDGISFRLGDGTCSTCDAAFRCYTSIGCRGTTITANSSQDCCLDQPTGMSYSFLDRCIDCFVYGFRQERFVGVERGQSYTLELFFKIPGDVSLRFVVGSVELVHGTTNDSDLSLLTSAYSSFAGQTFSVLVILENDNVGQEFNETAQIILRPTGGVDPQGALGSLTLDIVVIDSNVVTFELTETDYRSNEFQLAVNAVVGKDLRIANPVTLLVSPYTVAEAQTLGLAAPPGATAAPDQVFVRPDDNPFSPLYARYQPEDRMDFNNSVVPVTFEADELSMAPVTNKIVQIPIFDDTVDENSEELFVINLGLRDSVAPGGIQIGRHSSTGRIADNDETRIGFQRVNYTFTEPEFEETISGVVYLERENGQLTEQTYEVAITVSLTVPPGQRPASIPDDFSIGGDQMTISLLFPPDETLLDFPFTLRTDDLYEGTEVLEVRSASSRMLGTEAFTSPENLFASTLIEIEDNDTAVIGFNGTAYQVSEADGFVEFVFGVLEGELAEGITVEVGFMTVAGTAQDGVDYTAIMNRQFELTGRELVSVRVNITNDNIYETLQESFQGVLSRGTGFPSAISLGPDTATATIVDEDVVTIGFDRSTAYLVDEDAGSVNLGVEVRSGSIAEGVDISIDFSTQDGGAVASQDYTGVARSLTFSSTSLSQQVPVSILTDGLFEEDEQFLGNLASSGDSRIILDPMSATVSIQDVDEVDIGFSQASYNVNENDGNASLVVAVAMGRIAEGVTITVNFFTTFTFSAAEDDDYTAVNMTLTFSSTTTSIPVAVAITNDEVLEMAELFAGSLQLPAGASERVTIRPGSTVVNIVDDDSVTLSFNPVDYPVAEGSSIDLTVVLTGETAIPVTVDLNTQNGTAVAGADYTMVTQTVTFNPGDPSQTVTVETLTDTIAEDPEQFTAVISNPSMGGNIGSADTATVTINDDTAVVVEFSQPAFSINENSGSAVFTVSKLTDTTRTVSVLFSTIDGTATAGSDYVGVSDFLVTFAPSETSQEVSVNITDDGLFELDEESFSGSLSLTPGSSRVELGQRTSVATILDNDMLTVGFQPEEYNVTESVDGSVVLMASVLEGSLGRDLQLLVETEDGTAMAGSDYEAVSETITFTPTVDTVSVSVTILSDSAVEEEESFSARLSSTVAVNRLTFAPVSADVVIQDDDEATIGFEQTEYVVVESAMFSNVTIRLTGTISADTVVRVTTADDSAVSGDDYTAVNQLLTFNATVTAINISVPILDDSINEIRESFTVRITTSDGDVVFGNSATVVSIVDNDPVRLSFQEPIYMFNEGQGTASVCVNKVGDTTQTIAVRVSGSLQTGRINQVLTFDPDQFEHCVNFTVENDNIALEETESFVWNITLIAVDPTGLVQLGDNPTTNVLILDDDMLTLTVRKGGTVPENASVAETCIVFSNPFDREFEIQRSTQLAPNTTMRASLAEAGSDFGALNGTLTARPEDGVAGELCFNVTIMDDNIVEDAVECFGVTVALPEAERDNIILSGGSVECCIQDDDMVTIGFDPILFMANEDDGTVSLTVRVISGQLGRPVEATVTTEEGTATSTAPMDYNNPGMITLQFDSVDTEQLAVITIVNDDIFENEENFFANLVSFDQAVIVNPMRAEVRIQADVNDVPTIGFDPDSFSVMEDGGAVRFNVSVLDGTLERDLEVMFSTQSGTATQDADYQGTSTTLTFSSTVSQHSVAVNIMDDSIVEGDEQFTGNLALVTPGEAFLVPDVATVTISGDEPNDVVVIGFERDYTVEEGFMQEVCAVLVSGTLERDAVVTLSTEDDTAMAGSDYEALSIDLTFNADTASACANLSVTPDFLVEGTEMLTLQLTTSDSAVSLNPAESTVNITDDDTVTIGFDQTSYTVDEGDGTVTLTVSVRSGQLGRTVLATVTTEDGTATSTAPTDYTNPGTVTLSFDSTTLSQQVVISIENDDIYESVENFFANLASADPAVMVDPTRAEVVIAEDDADVPTIGFVPASFNVMEGDQVTFTVQVISGTLERPVVVEFSTQSGTATEDADYQGTTMSFTFENENSEFSVTVNTINDIFVEGDEQFTGNLVLGGFGTALLAPDVATVTISGNEPNDIVMIRVEKNYTISEGRTREVCVVADSRTLERDAVVTLSTEDGTATAGSDYEALSVELTFNADISRRCVNLTTIVDSLVEGMETLRLVVTTSDSAVTLGPGATVTIVEDDVVIIGFDQTSYTVEEGDGRVTLTVSVQSGQLGRTVLATVTTEDDTATSTAPMDYTDPGTVSLLFDSTTLSQSVVISIENDDIYESVERFFANLASTDMAVMVDPERAEVVIAEDGNDVPTIGFVSDSFNVMEGDQVTFTVQVINGTLERDVEVEFSTQSGTATEDDYDGTTMTLTFSSTVSQHSVTVDTTDDSIVEGDEQFTGNIALTTTGTAVLVPDVSTVTISGNEPNDMVVIRVDRNYTVNEGSTLEVCVVVDSGTLERDAVVTLSTEDGTAMAGSDYEALSVELTFNADTNRSCANLTTIVDSLVEGMETLRLVVTTSDSAVTLGPGATSTVTIVEDDFVIIGFDQTTYTVEEGDGSVTLTVSVLSGQVERGVEATLTFEDGTATSTSPVDYIDPGSLFLSFDSSQQVVIFIENDNIYESVENFFANLTSSNPGVRVNPARAEVVILEDSDDVPTIGFVSDSFNVMEGDQVTFTVQVISGTLERPVEVEFSTQSGTATEDDYDGTTMTLTFSSTVSQHSVTVDTTDDSIVEGDEQFTGNIALTTTGTAVLAPNVSTVTISGNEPNDMVVIGVESDYTVSEGSTLEVCAVLVSGTLERDAVVTLSTEDDTAMANVDYNALSVDLTFNADTNRSCDSLTVTADSLVEGEETLTIRLTTSDSAVTLNPAESTVTIVEEDRIIIGIGEVDVTVNEGEGTVEVCAEVISGDLQRSVSFTLTSTDGTATAPEDYGGLSGSFEFTAGGDVVCANVTISGDTFFENDETFTVTLTTSDSQTIVQSGRNVATVTIADDDSITIGFQPSTEVVSESDGSVELCARLLRGDQQLERDVVISFMTNDGSASAGSDYTLVQRDLTFNRDNLQRCVQVPISTDNIAEGPETFTGNLINSASISRLTLNPSEAVVTIQDVNIVTVSFVQIVYSFDENIGTGEVCLVKDSETPDEVSVTVRTTDGTATSGADYIGGVFNVTFEASADNRQCIEITIISDTISENSESFTATVEVRSDSGVTLGTPSTATITITDTGIRVNDTAIGDPLMTVPINVSPEDLAILGTDRISLCYEIHGRADQYFNLVTDECTSVNAHYAQLTSFLNVIGQLGVRARDSASLCRNILVDVNGCTASVNGVTLNSTFMSGGISVRPYSNRVRISVPNCNELSLVMWVFCESRTLADPEAPGGQITGNMIKFVVMRGLNFGHSMAHGLIGQFWNVPARISNFTGVDRNGMPQPQRFVVNIAGSTGVERSFTGWYYPLSWEFIEDPCLYVGNRQGGPIYEVQDPNDPVIEGRYKDYRVQSAFSEENYGFGRFDEDSCSA